MEFGKSIQNKEFGRKTQKKELGKKNLMKKTEEANKKTQTLHSVFSFNFGSEFLTLSDKIREEKRKMFKNLQVLIIDEILLVDADMLYNGMIGPVLA